MQKYEKIFYNFLYLEDPLPLRHGKNINLVLAIEYLPALKGRGFFVQRPIRTNLRKAEHDKESSRVMTQSYSLRETRLSTGSQDSWLAAGFFTIREKLLPWWHIPLLSYVKQEACLASRHVHGAAPHRAYVN